MSNESSGAEDPTTLHMAAAKAGDIASLNWIVERFTPLLLAQARYRMAPALARYLDAEDIVQELWGLVLVRLPTLKTRDGRNTPVVMRFLSTSLVQMINSYARRHLARGGAIQENITEGTLAALNPHAEPAATISSIVRSELKNDVLQAIESLDAKDRQVIVLRSIECLSNKEAAEILTETTNAVSLRHNRALQKLRERLDQSIFDDLN